MSRLTGWIVALVWVAAAMQGLLLAVGEASWSTTLYALAAAVYATAWYEESRRLHRLREACFDLFNMLQEIAAKDRCGS